MNDDGLKIFDRETKVVEPDIRRSIGLTFVLAVLTAIGVGVVVIWAAATAINWFIVHVVSHLPNPGVGLGV